MPRRWFTYGYLLTALGVGLILAGLAITFVKLSLYGFILILLVAVGLKVAFGLGRDAMDRSPLDTLEDRRYAQGQADADLDTALSDALWHDREDARFAERDAVRHLTPHGHVSTPDYLLDGSPEAVDPHDGVELASRVEP
ncbi:MAG: hypothetical protein AAGG50_07465 [Bacteroidota bacterium]